MESDLALLALRISIGVIFVAHGLQKLLGWWEGPGWEGWKGFIGYLRIRPVAFWASVSLAAELGGGLALIAGLLVPLAAAGLVAQAMVLGWKVHRPKGFWAQNGGIEFPLAFLAGSFAIQLLGPGAWSLDAVLAVDVLYEPAVRWVILALAVAGALVALAISSMGASPAGGEQAHATDA
ncbi:MAG: DoxX family protein [Candidatus Limnocylindria bacterium]